MALEGLTDAAVQADPAGVAHLLGERLAHQRVREAELVGGAAGLDEAGGFGLLDRFERVVGERLQHVQAEVAADHGGDRQRLPRRLGELGEATRDDVADAVGQPRIAQRLAHEERVAAGALVQAP